MYNHLHVIRQAGRFSTHATAVNVVLSVPPECSRRCRESRANAVIEGRQQQHRRRFFCDCSIGIRVAACASVTARLAAYNSRHKRRCTVASKAASRVAGDHHSGAWRRGYRVGCISHGIIAHRERMPRERQSTQPEQRDWCGGSATANALRCPQIVRVWARAGVCKQMQLQRWRAATGRGLRRQHHSGGNPAKRAQAAGLTALAPRAPQMPRLASSVKRRCAAE
jgi:hypothetical protein